MARFAEHFARCALQQQAALVQKGNAVRHRCGKTDLVRHHHHGHAVGGQVAHHLEHFAGQLGVERGGGFVKQHDLGLAGQGARNGHALLLTARELRWVVTGAVFQSHFAQLRHGAFFGLRLGHAARGFERLAHIAQRRHVRPQVELLKAHADVRAHLADALRAQAHALATGFLRETQGLAVDQNRARRGLFQKGHAAQKRAFARARRANHAGDLALGNVQVNAVQDLGLAKALAHAAHRNGRIWKSGCRTHVCENVYLESRFSAKLPMRPASETMAQ